MTPVVKTGSSVEEYLAFDRSSEIRYEYVDGEMFARPRASRAHVRISMNIGSVLDSQFGDGGCESYIVDLRVNVGATFFYPDVVVACPPVEVLDKDNDTLLNPTVIFEVLSPSTEVYDRTRKFDRYALISSLTDYILVATDQRRVDRLTRHGNGQWLLTTYTDPRSVIELDGIGCRLTLSDIYRRVDPFTTSDASA